MHYLLLHQLSYSEPSYDVIYGDKNSKVKEIFAGLPCCYFIFGEIVTLEILVDFTKTYHQTSFPNLIQVINVSIVDSALKKWHVRHVLVLIIGLQPGVYFSVRMFIKSSAKMVIS